MYNDIIKISEIHHKNESRESSISHQRVYNIIKKVWYLMCQEGRCIELLLYHLSAKVVSKPQLIIYRGISINKDSLHLSIKLNSAYVKHGIKLPSLRESLPRLKTAKVLL